MTVSDSDLPGVASADQPITVLAEGAVQGAGAFLSRICLPAAEEFGLLLRDKVGHWRQQNAVRIAQKAEQKLLASGEEENLQAHPKLIAATIEFGSWSEDEGVQEMWAGLLASSCSPGEWDESNLIFTNLLAQLTTSEARILRFACKSATKIIHPAGLIGAELFTCDLEQLNEVSGIQDLHCLDRELDHLRSLQLIFSGFDAHLHQPVPNLTPTPLALHMYARCEGARGSVVEFYGLEEGT